MRRVVLVHGAATAPDVWESTTTALHGSAEVSCPERPQSGDLDTEVEFLAPLCAGAFVVGVSGGATLGLELVARGVPVTGAVLHEPAAGSLMPGLLSHVAAGLEAGGVAGFGAALYGPAWDVSRTSATAETVAAEFAMFGAFEPAPLGERAADVLLTVGERSPEARHDSVRALCRFLGTRRQLVPGAGHAAHLENGSALAALVPRTG
ncbi:Alpha/beta hydrolase family protein [Prauserella aidingensis]|uniref:alpha/beta fold hydrolase n=1 Tax=Prauserella aidingensis TaxID=387890 RepID=UPI0020A35200|nr:alpha/beta hydrolase [Prauserella aidingensis]MCP2252991.1 Alpha/beta hydrolase family protein [Prauserella aidingensis]